MNYNRAIAMKRFSYPASFTSDSVDGGFVITFRDLPEAITQADTEQQGLIEAADCLEEAIAIPTIKKLFKNKNAAITNDFFGWWIW